MDKKEDLYIPLIKRAKITENQGQLVVKIPKKIVEDVGIRKGQEMIFELNTRGEKPKLEIDIQ